MSAIGWLKSASAAWMACILVSAPWSGVTAADSHPKYKAGVSLLTHDRQYLRKADAPDFWRLMPFYVPQVNECACSVASLTMVFNAAIKDRAGIPDTERNLTQDALLERVREVPLRELVSKEGFRGRQGLTLDELKRATGEAARVLGAKVQVTAYTLGGRPLEEFRKLLVANEADGSDFLLAHFVQDDLTGALGGPYAHISPIGAYDEATRRVLILDVDREWYAPYWVSDADLLAACNHVTKEFGAGGLLHVRFDAVRPPP